MAKYYHPDVFDNGLGSIRTLAGTNNIDMLLISAYTQGDNYATVDGNKLATIDLVQGDLTLGDQGTLGRQLAVAAKSGTASATSGATPNLHVAIVDVTTSKVLAVTDETTDQQITSGNPINLSAFNLKQNQPV